MEETCAGASRALGSSLWEVWALRRHAAPALAAAAAAVFAAADPRATPVALAPPDLAAVRARPNYITYSSSYNTSFYWNLCLHSHSTLN